MNKVKQTIIEEIVQPMLSNHMSMASGYVLDYNSTTNKAVIEYINPHNGDRGIMREVVISRPPFGFHPVEPKPGDRVSISFEGGNIHAPRVTSYFDEQYHREDGPHENLTVEYAVTVPDILSYI